MLARTTPAGSGLPVIRTAPAAAVEAMPAAPRRSRWTGPETDMLGALMHGLPLGVLVVDEALRLLFANPAGAAILEQGDAICLVHGALREPSGGVLESRLQRLLRCGAGPAAEASFHLLRCSGHRPYEVTLRPLPLREGACSGGRHAIVYVRDPDAGVAVDESALRQRYGLTPAEARTAVALTHGGTLPEDSELRKLRPMTIRGYIKQIFARTGTHSQLDVVRLVLTGRASFALPPRSDTNDRE